MTTLTDRQLADIRGGVNAGAYAGTSRWDDQAADWVATARDVRNLLDHIDHLTAANERLTSALTRTESNFRAAVNGKPVRDMAENLAENRVALDGAR